MKRLVKSWVFWAFGVLGPLLAVAAMLRHGMTNEVCWCGSHRTLRVAALEVGSFQSPSLMSWGEANQESQASIDVLRGAHEHRWFVLGGWKSRPWGGTEALFPDLMAAGVVMSMPNLLHVYNRDPRFRDFIQAKMKRGEATRESVAQILMLGDAETGAAAAVRDAWQAQFDRVNKDAARPR